MIRYAPWSKLQLIMIDHDWSETEEDDKLDFIGSSCIHNFGVINFRGMNIHLPAILGFTRCQDQCQKSTVSKGKHCLNILHIPMTNDEIAEKWVLGGSTIHIYIIYIYICIIYYTFMYYIIYTHIYIHISKAIVFGLVGIYIIYLYIPCSIPSMLVCVHNSLANPSFYHH